MKIDKSVMKCCFCHPLLAALVVICVSVVTMVTLWVALHLSRTASVFELEVRRSKDLVCHAPGVEMANPCKAEGSHHRMKNGKLGVQL